MSTTETPRSADDHIRLPRASFDLLKAEARELQAARWRLEDENRELSNQLTIATAENELLVARVTSLVIERNTLQRAAEVARALLEPDPTAGA